MTTESRPYRVALLVILAVTAALWCGVAMIGLNSDDYQFIKVLAPIRSIGDVFRAFVIPDANPSYFRPVAAALTSLDFLLFQTWGGGYHLTNLLFHLIATALVFFVARDVFRLRDAESLLATLLFGLLASHETNMTVDMMRPDSIAAVFMMLTLLLETSDRIQKSIVSRIAALICFALAVLSKEIAVLTPLLLAGVWWHERRGIRDIIKRLIPYAAMGVVFFVYHSHFTSQPSELLQSHSIVSLLRNTAFSIGYMILPVDLEIARNVMAHTVLLAILALAGLTILTFVLLRLDREARQALLLPLFFALLTGAILCLDFQRWRTYLPSVGFVAITAVIVMRSRKPLRLPLQLLLAILIAFHIWRAIDAQAEFRDATGLLDDLQHSMQKELANVPPHSRIGILVSPAKLGSAGVLQVGHDAFIRRAEAVAKYPDAAAVGLTRNSTIQSWTAIDVYAIDRDRRYRGLRIDRTASNTYTISVPDSGVFIVPTGTERSWRDVHFQVGDSINTSNYVLRVEALGKTGVTQVKVEIRDTLATLLTFDGETRFRRLGP